MHQLLIPPDFPLPSMERGIAELDTMYLNEDPHYVSVGLSALSVIEQALDGVEPRSILDLPSGFGRVTRVLRARWPDAAITASDLDLQGIAFCAAQMGARPIASVRDFRKLRLRDTYDLIWVGSLITHLPPRQTREFFTAMSRHMTERSTLVVSSHGPSIIPRLREKGYGLTPEAAAALIEEYERTGFGYRDYGGGGSEYGVALTNTNYGISLTNEIWLRQALSECGLRMDTYQARVWDDHHDVVVARLAEVPAPKARGILGRMMRWRS